ncbi:aspartate-semialdehyde dehydrogenase [bacterium]|nr:aspartate-semialdehyde dehydrogenase [bacterium]
MKEQSRFGFMREVFEIGPGYNIGIVGATGIIGRTLLSVLHRRKFPVGELHIYASPESEGKWIETPYGQMGVEKLNTRKPPHHDLVFLAAGSSVARTWGWRFARRGVVVIDKSAYFRDKSYAPLIVPEVNPDYIDVNTMIIANPNCTTIPLVTVIAPLHREYGLKNLTVVTFQSVSGAGRGGIVALTNELESNDEQPSAFKHRIANNVIPWIGEGYKGSSGEELKMIRETRRILNLPRLPVRVTAVRVPVVVGHSIAVHAQFRRSVTVSEVRKILMESPGVELVDDPEAGKYPMPLDAAGQDDVLVGRIRRDRGRQGLALWISADNLRKGAATNAVQIAEIVVSKRFNPPSPLSG